MFLVKTRNKYDIMSVSEREQAKLVHGERRMSITGCACDIMSHVAACACAGRYKANAKARHDYGNEFLRCKSVQ